MHLNPNSVLQLSIFIHLCEAFLGIVPHFGLWKHLYHCKAGLRDGVLQVTGGASFELRKNRKSVYLDIPLPDNNMRCTPDATRREHSSSVCMLMI